MKKAIAFMLTLALVFCFAGCGKDKSEDNYYQEEKPLVHGTVEDNVYKNSFADITFTAPEGWKYFTDSELLSTTEDTAQKLTDEKLLEIFTEVGLAYDMTAYSDELHASVGVIFANKNHNEFSGLDAKSLITTMVEQITLDTSNGISEDMVNIGNNTYLRICITTKTAENETGYATFYARETGSSIILIVAACTDNFTVADCESCFS